MQTKLIPLYDNTPTGEKAESILRSCVHCGFCNATCPTYQALGDELDGPRGRIYLIKQMLEGQPISETTRQHLDRCLTCRACETTCPSGVRYHELLDIGREVALTHAPRKRMERLKRAALLWLLSSPKLFALFLSMGRLFRSVMPASFRAKVPQKSSMELGGLSQENYRSPTRPSNSKVLLLEGCVQNAMTPEINHATSLVLSTVGYQVSGISEQQCCGALQQHLDQTEHARERARKNIDHWLERIDSEGASHIVVNASGCGVFVKDYPELFLDDQEYRGKAEQLSRFVLDPVELLSKPEVLDCLARELEKANFSPDQFPESLAYHPPCTLQHGQQLHGAVEALFGKLGIDLKVPENSHLCCGSAGTYSIMQPEISGELKQNKLDSLQVIGSDLVLTANIGCQSHLASGSEVPVVHWIQLLAKVLTNYTKL